MDASRGAGDGASRADRPSGRSYACRARQCWGIAETRSLDRRTLLDHDVLVNAVSTPHPVTPFLTSADVADPARRLAVVADVTCDVRSEYNVLPI